MVYALSLVASFPRCCPPPRSSIGQLLESANFSSRRYLEAEEYSGCLSCSWEVSFMRPPGTPCFLVAPSPSAKFANPSPNTPSHSRLLRLCKTTYAFTEISRFLLLLPALPLPFSFTNQYLLLDQGLKMDNKCLQLLLLLFRTPASDSAPLITPTVISLFRSPLFVPRGSCRLQGSRVVFGIVLWFRPLSRRPKSRCDFESHARSHRGSNRPLAASCFPLVVS